MWRNAQATEYAAFYFGGSQQFPAEFRVGARVLGTGLGQHEHKLFGTVIERSADGERLLVRYDDGDELDAYLDDVELS